LLAFKPIPPKIICFHQSNLEVFHYQHWREASIGERHVPTGFMRYFFYRIADIQKSLVISFLSIFGFAGLAPGAEVAPPTPKFTNAAHVEQSLPYLTLAWEVSPAPDRPSSTEFELQVAATPDFRDAQLRYRGPDEATFISGLAEGEYFFRVRSLRQDKKTSAWSEPLYLIVEYDSLAKAFLLFGVGAFVSIATVALVVTGDRRARREGPHLPNL
jgi:hypothetical protein